MQHRGTGTWGEFYPDEYQNRYNRKFVQPQQRGRRSSTPTPKTPKDRRGFESEVVGRDRVSRSGLNSNGKRASLNKRDSIGKKDPTSPTHKPRKVAPVGYDIPTKQTATLAIPAETPEEDEGGFFSRIVFLFKIWVIHRLINQRAHIGEERVKFRRWLQKYMAVSTVGYIIDLTNIILSGVSCVLYVWETYANELAGMFEMVDRGFCVFFGMDYILRVYLADRRIKYMRSLMAVIDLLTLIPVMFSFVEVSEDFELAIRLVRVLRVLRIVRINRFILSYMESDLNQQVTQLVTTIITACFFCAGIVQIFENAHRRWAMMSTLDFHDSVYFVVVTISTVGYGDISPASDLSRIAVTILISAALVYIPKATNQIVTMMSTKSIYARNSFRPSPHTNHVLVCGSLDVVGTRAFLMELFHEDHGNVDLHCVLLCEQAPSTGMENLLKSPPYSVNVTYLQGSPLDVADLMRASALRAKAVFLLCDKFTLDADAEDAATILRALSIKRFVLQVTGQDILTCIQLMRSENKQHFTLSHRIMKQDMARAETSEENADGGSVSGQGNTSVPNTPKEQPKDEPSPSSHTDKTPLRRALTLQRNSSTHGSESDLNASSVSNTQTAKSLADSGISTDPVICVNEIKMNLLAQACLCPGIITMIGNLVMSVDSPMVDNEDEDNEEEADDAWLREYHNGSEFEIYRTRLSAVFEGISFSVAAQIIHQKLGALMFALELNVTGCSRVIMNPGDLLIPDIKKYDVFCFVIAQDKPSADLSDFDKHLSMLTLRGRSQSDLVSKRGSSSIKSMKRMMATRSVYESEMHEIAQTLNRAKGDSLFDCGNAQGSEKHKQIKSLLTTNGNIQQRKWGVVKDMLPSAPPRRQTEGTAAESEGAKYFIMEEPKDLEEVTVTSDLKTDFPEIREHIIICGNLSGLLSLVRTLRAKHLAHMMPIVILHPEPPSFALWKRISCFPFIFYLQGSSTERSDLIKAGVRYASRAIVLARSTGTKQDVSDGTMSDAHAIFAHQGVIGLNGNIQIVTELVNASNVGFLDIGCNRQQNMSMSFQSVHTVSKELANANYHNALQFIAGIVYSSSMLDTLICQSYYNQHITTVFQQLVTGHSSEAQDDKDRETSYRAQLEKRFLAGLSSEEQMQELENMRYVQAIKPSYLFQIPVPKAMVGKPYSELFKHLSGDFSMVPLGLYRGTTKILSPNMLGNPIPYVVTNPPPETICHKPDKVFVLSKDAPNTKLSGKTVAEVLNEVSNLTKQTQSTTPKKRRRKQTPQEKHVEKLQADLAFLKSTVSDIKTALHAFGNGASKDESSKSTQSAKNLSKIEKESEALLNIVSRKKTDPDLRAYVDGSQKELNLLHPELIPDKERQTKSMSKVFAERLQKQLGKLEEGLEQDQRKSQSMSQASVHGKNLEKQKKREQNVEEESESDKKLIRLAKTFATQTKGLTIDTENDSEEEYNLY